MFGIRPGARLVLFVALAAGVSARCAAMVFALLDGEEALLLAFPLAVIFPAILAATLLLLPPAASREGLLMRVGAIIQLVLIVMLPGLALYLALGFPVVFLVVELFETRLPSRLREPLRRLVLA